MYQNTNIYHCLLSSICTYTLFTYIPLYMYYVNVCIIVRWHRHQFCSNSYLFACFVRYSIKQIPKNEFPKTIPRPHLEHFSFSFGRRPLFIWFEFVRFSWVFPRVRLISLWFSLEFRVYFEHKPILLPFQFLQKPNTIPPKKLKKKKKKKNLMYIQKQFWASHKKKLDHINNTKKKIKLHTHRIWFTELCDNKPPYFTDEHHPAPTFTPPELPKRVHVRGSVSGKVSSPSRTNEHSIWYQSEITFTERSFWIGGV